MNTAELQYVIRSIMLMYLQCRKRGDCGEQVSKVPHSWYRKPKNQKHNSHTSKAARIFLTLAVCIGRGLLLNQLHGRTRSCPLNPQDGHWPSWLSLIEDRFVLDYNRLLVTRLQSPRTHGSRCRHLWSFLPVSDRWGQPFIRLQDFFHDDGVHTATHDKQTVYSRLTDAGEYCKTAFNSDRNVSVSFKIIKK